jgi:hypothetical protein
VADGNLTASLLRPDDLLALQFEFINLTLDMTQSPPALIRTQSGQPAFVLVSFAPQHISEECATEDANGKPLNAVNPPVAAFLSGETQLAFQLPDSVPSIPLTEEGLLDWLQLAPSVAANAIATAPDINPPPATQPGPEETFIELPYRLMLSPDATGGWKHSVVAVTRGQRTELWHTRLGVRAGNGIDESQMPVVRAIWARDLAKTVPADQSGGALDADTRGQIARLSSDFTMARGVLFGEAIQTPILFVPPPLEIRHLTLSALGAWLDANGTWDFPNPNPASAFFPNVPEFDLEAWRQIVAAGRDQYVRVVKRGFLFPFGNRASITSITERKLEQAPDGTRVEYLMQRHFITVLEPCKNYATDAAVAGYLHQGREMPLRSICITTLTTPALDRDPVPPEFPTVLGVPFPFHILAQDVDGQALDFSMPLMFVLADTTSGAIQVANGDITQRTADLRSQRVAFAPSQDSGDTHLKAATITFNAQTDIADLSPPFLPILESALVAIPAVDHLLGSSGAPPGVTFQFHDAYLQNGFDPQTNPTQTFAKLNDLALSLPPDRAGGLMAPQMDAVSGSLKPSMIVNGLSRTLGPVPQVDAAVAGTLEPILDALNMNLLGGITVKDVVSAVAGGSIEQKLKQIPGMITRELPDKIQTTLHWQPALQILNNNTSHTDPPPDVPIITTEETVLTIDAQIVSPLNGSEPTFTVQGSLTNFGLNLLSVIVVTFDQIRFTVEQGKKPDVTTEGVNVEFVGPLSFVNQLAELLPADGFSDPPSIQVTPDGITAGYSLGIPSVGVGAFSLENIAISAEMELPFVDKPVGLRLAFSERFHPFLVTVSLVGGGGFLAIELSTRGIENIEGSMELGGNITVSLVIVEANAHVMIGFHFGIRQADGGGVLMDFTAYIRVGASVDILGIVGISIDIYLGLGFTPKFLMSPPPSGILGVVSGVASVTVGVHILFVDKTFQLTFERSFNIPARADIPLIGTVSLPILGDPSFDEMISPDDWQQYCQAFA